MWSWNDPRFWNTTSADLCGGFGCDEALTPADDMYLRAISIKAPPHLVYSWLCQLRVAPYSYDWIDNLGRRSPRTRTENLTELEGNERFMYIFNLITFERERAITLELNTHQLIRLLAGRCAITYRIDSGPSPYESRLVVKLVLRYPRGPIGWLMRILLPRGDLIMMRKQLLTLRELAEHEARVGAP
jgi:hypothetical protein